MCVRHKSLIRGGYIQTRRFTPSIPRAKEEWDIWDTKFQGSNAIFLEDAS